MENFTFTHVNNLGVNDPMRPVRVTAPRFLWCWLLSATLTQLKALITFAGEQQARGDLFGSLQTRSNAASAVATILNTLFVAAGQPEGMAEDINEVLQVLGIAVDPANLRGQAAQVEEL